MLATLSLTKPSSWDALWNEFFPEFPFRLDGDPRGVRPGGFSPAVKIWETDDAFHAEAEIPGVTLEDLEVEVTGNQFTFRGERKAPDAAGMVRQRHERRYGTFERMLRFGAEIDAAKVEASVVNGVLTVRLPKNANAVPRKITVKVKNS